MECVGHSHDHDHEDDEGISLQKSIDMAGVWCLNEEVSGSARKVLKPYPERFTTVPSLRSNAYDVNDDDDDNDSDDMDDDDDDAGELLLHVPFQEAVTLHSLAVRVTGLRKVHVFSDVLALDLETARESTPDLSLPLVPPEHEDEDATIDYPCRPAGKFRNVTSVTLHFHERNGADVPATDDDDVDDNETRQRRRRRRQTEITFVGFKGRSSQLKRQAVTCVYETRGMKKDHKTPGGDFTARYFL